MRQPVPILLTRSDAVSLLNIPEADIDDILAEVEPCGYWNNPTEPIYPTPKIKKAVKKFE